MAKEKLKLFSMCCGRPVDLKGGLCTGCKRVMNDYPEAQDVRGQNWVFINGQWFTALPRNIRRAGRTIPEVRMWADSLQEYVADMGEIDNGQIIIRADNSESPQHAVNAWSAGTASARAYEILRRTNQGNRGV